jgi:LysM repeat protein
VQEQVDDQDLAGLARPRVPAARPVASADPTVLGPAPAPLDCPYLHLDDDGPSCLALPPAIRLSRRQVEIVCAVAAHVSCPRLIKADAGRLPVAVDPPARVVRRDRPAADGTAAPASAMGLAASLEPAATASTAVPAGPTASPAVATSAAAASTPTDPIIRATSPAATPTAPAAAGRAPAPSGEPPAPASPPAAPTAPPVAQRVGAALSLARATARSHITLRPATATAWVILVATLIVVIALLTARGGLTLPSAAPSSAGLAGASAAGGTPSAAPTVASPSPSASIPPSASPSASIAASPSPSPSASGSSPFTAEQLAVLKPCPGKPGCYQYRIKSGDNLRNIATFFGLTYSALLAANPQITNPSVIHVGQQVIVPYPTAPKASATPKP